MNKITIAVGASSFGKASKKPLEILENKGVNYKLNPYGRKLTKEETIEFLQGVDGLLAGLEPLDRTVLETCKGKLKAITRIGIGMDNVDVSAAKELGIGVDNTPDAPTQAVAEMTLSAMLALARGIVPATDAMRSRNWEKKIGFSITKSNVLIIGYGRIGKAVGRHLEHLGARLLIWDPAFKKISVSTIEEGLKEAKIVSIHASGSAQIIGEKEISIMPQGAMLLNAARGGVVNEDALYNALKSGHLAGAWLDAYSNEPYDGPLCDLPNVLLTPHVSSYTSLCREEMEVQAVSKILEALHV